jgi:GT2 family glycosyltransferase
VTPALSTIVVSWRSGADVARLAAAFPDAAATGGRHELVVVDNAGEPELARLERPGVHVVAAGGNLGFAGGCNLGARRSAAPLLLFLNPDAAPVADALDRLVDGFAARPDAAGLVPRLVGEDGRPQSDWQLRELPSAPALLAHAFFWDPARRAARQEGATIGQPAAAALALRRAVFERLGGFDERFAPAWFEDVDLARRLADAGERLLYWPAATFRHRIGSSLPALGYGNFLRAYDRNLARYLRLHHGRGWELAFRLLVPIGALARLAALPLRRPRRAPSRRVAAAALLGAARGAFDGWAETAAADGPAGRSSR